MSTAILEDVVEAMDRLTQRPEQSNWSDSDWTSQIKLQCLAIARIRKYKIFTSGLQGADSGEWLFDVCLARWPTGQGLEELALVLESEWIQKDWEIDNDFLKLVIARADSRAMIFQANTLERAKDHFVRLRNLAESFPASRRGDQYLLSCWIAKTRKFEHKRFTIGSLICKYDSE